jgi:hypothetical protein
MKNTRSRYYGHRFPPEIISYAVWVYHRFCLSFRDVEDLLAERGITVSYEAIRIWCQKFGPGYARSLKRRQGRLGDSWHLDKVFIDERVFFCTRHHSPSVPHIVAASSAKRSRYSFPEIAPGKSPRIDLSCVNQNPWSIGLDVTRISPTSSRALPSAVPASA